MSHHESVTCDGPDCPEKYDIDPIGYAFRGRSWMTLKEGNGKRDLHFHCWLCLFLYYKATVNPSAEA